MPEQQTSPGTPEHSADQPEPDGAELEDLDDLDDVDFDLDEVENKIAPLALAVIGWRR